MNSAKLKEHLLKIAEEVTEDTKLEDVYMQLALLTDIEESESQEASGDTISHADVIEQSKAWLK